MKISYLTDTDWIIDHFNNVKKITKKLKELKQAGDNNSYYNNYHAYFQFYVTATRRTISMDGTAFDNTSGVKEVPWSNSKGGTATGTTSWSVSSITLSSGDNTITVTAKDNAGNTGTDAIAVTYSGDTVATPTPTPSTTPTPTPTPTPKTSPSPTKIPAITPFVRHTRHLLHHPRQYARKVLSWNLCTTLTVSPSWGCCDHCW